MNITIIGCGWLGLELGKSLVLKNHTVYGSTRTPENIGQLEQLGIKPFLLDTERSIEIPNDIRNATELLVLTIPPIQRNHPEIYGNLLSKIIAEFPEECAVIFTSSTGVYPSDAGSYDENYSFSPDQYSSLYHAEQAVIKASKSSIVLRMGGLFGEDRHPIHSIVKKGTVSNPQGRINFVHRKDIIRFIELLVEEGFKQEIVNLVYPDHPERGAYYERAAKHFGYSVPTFESGDTTVRIISSKKSEITFGFSYNYALDLLD